MRRKSVEEWNQAMSEGYWKLWNPEEQARIDRDIEANRKADGLFRIASIPEGADVRVEQTGHAFIFGAHIFNFDQLGSDECNEKYKALYGTLFNSATIAFYWRCFEPEEGKPRFAAKFEDTAAYWNKVAEPKKEPHWRRPAPDPVVAFCKSRGIRLHGHTLTWGYYCWQYPDWVLEKLPAAWRARFKEHDRCVNPTHALFEAFTPAEIEEMIPGFVDELNLLNAKRIMEIARHYKDAVDSWDVVNESAIDFEQGKMIPGDGVCKSRYGLMPGDYTYRSFKIADAVFPKSVKLNINDYYLKTCYRDQVRDLLGRGCKVDIMGAQMHLFDPQSCLDIADGKSEVQSPRGVRETMARISEAGLPIHLSEITITAPPCGERGEDIQAVISRNLYRLWFSLKPMMGITWWNVVDDCGAPGEPSVSGLFRRNMEPKQSYYALNDLIHSEWKTDLSVRAGKGGEIAFRGFRGSYRLTWENSAGVEECANIELR